MPQWNAVAFPVRCVLTSRFNMEAISQQIYVSYIGFHYYHAYLLIFFTVSLVIYFSSGTPIKINTNKKTLLDNHF
jgi:hypothetical protein